MSALGSWRNEAGLMLVQTQHALTDPSFPDSGGGGHVVQSMGPSHYWSLPPHTDHHKSRLNHFWSQEDGVSLCADLSDCKRGGKIWLVAKTTYWQKPLNETNEEMCTIGLPNWPRLTTAQLLHVVACQVLVITLCLCCTLPFQASSKTRCFWAFGGPLYVVE